MLKYMRRASTSVPRSLLALPNPTHANAFFLSRVSQPSKRRLVASSLGRGLPSLPRWSRDTKQYHGIQAQEEEPYNDEASGNRDEASRRSRFSGENPKAPQDAVFTKFAQLGENGMVCNAVVSAITTDMGLETMTLVQSMTISEALKGGDVLAQARTGTGKTLAFLLPVLQNIISKDPSLEKRSYSRRTQGPDIRAIIISPTRELAEQIAVEASKVVKHTGLVVQVAVGGNSKQLGLRKIRNEGCHILVGTPGRLNDILKDPYSGVRAPELSAFVLDEADRLLDQGFLPEIESIQKLLPDRREVDRQTLMFSATVPREVLGVVGKTMKPNYHFVQTVQPGEADTHLKVPQKMVHVAGMENLMPALLELCKREIARKDTPLPFKAIVFFGANSEVKLAAAIFNNLGRDGNDRLTGHPLHPMKMFEIHSKLSQPQRTYCADAFRRASTGILFSSDVTARGMDFPNVTHVIQIGLPTSRDVYIHRLGRTARGDKAGEGVLFLTPPEVNEARQRLRKLPLERDESYATAIIDMTRDAELPLVVAETLTQVISATKGVPEHMKSAAYMATLGHFSWMQPKQNLLNMMNNRSKFAWGLEIPPAISPMLARKLGLAHLSGINIGTPLYSDDAGSRGGFGGRGGRSDFGGRGERAIGGGRGDSPRGNPWEHRGRIDPNGGSSYGERRGGSFGDRGRSSSYGERRGGSYSDRGASSSYGDRSGTSSYGESSGGSYSGRGGNSFSRGGRGGGRGGSFGTRDDGRSSRRSASDRTGGSLAQLYEGGDGESRGYSAKRESRSSY